jgi:SAM-dependent methyltransferase
MENPMRHPRLHAALFIALLAIAPAILPEPAHAQAGKEYTPQVGQEGKDVIWVPTPMSLIERMLDMAKLTAKDIHYDLGSGDGRTVIAAAKRGAQAYGVEFNPDMVALSKRNAEKEGVAERAHFINGDIFQTDFSKATVITLYLLPSLNVKLRPTILKMKPGTRVVSHAFNMDDWQPDQTESVDGRTAYFWIVPARVEGTWKWNVAGSGPREYELTARQQYQQVEGIVRLDGKMGQFRNAKLEGDRLSFSVIELTGGTNTIRRDFSGRVNGDTIEGTVKHPGGESKWTATRVPALPH